MSKNTSTKGLEPVIEEFQKIFKPLSRETSDEFQPNLTEQNQLYILAKDIIDRLSPETLASMHKKSNHFVRKLTNVLGYFDDKEYIIKLGLLYERLGDYSGAKQLYLFSKKHGEIENFISRSIQIPQAIEEGVDAIRGLMKLYEQENHSRPVGLIEAAYNRAIGFENYDLALNLAYLINDAWRKDEALRLKIRK
jgi:hypothetical protein